MGMFTLKKKMVVSTKGCTSRNYSQSMASFVQEAAFRNKSTQDNK